MSAQNKKNITRLAILFTACGVLLLAVAVGGLFLRCRALEKRLDEAFLESLTAHAVDSGKNAGKLIEDTQILLENAAQRLEQDGRPLDKSWAGPILEMMNLGERRSDISYLDLDDMAAAEPGSEELRVFQQLQDGKNVVGGLISAQGETEFYFLVAQPVEQEGELAGAVLAEVNAGLLSQQGHDSVLFHSVHRAIAGEDGLVVCGSVPESRGRSLTELCLESGLPQREAEQLTAAYLDQEDGSFRCTTDSGRVYAAWAAIGCNGWRVLQFSQTPDLRVEETSVAQTVAMAVSLLVCAVLAAWIWRQRAKLAVERLRYSTLAEFRDTLIFEYDCRDDSLEFTSNAMDTLELKGLRLENVTDLMNEFPVFHPDDMESVRRALAGTEHMMPDEIEHDRVRMKRKDGSYSWYRSQYKAVFNAEGKPIRLIGTLTDISAQIDREIELRKQAQQDPLTGVYNRAGVKLINARLEQISRGVLFMLDLDDFKSVNDNYGHAAGDRLLQGIGGVLRDTFRSDDIVARVGGDEFVAFLSGSDSRATAEQKGQELLERVRQLRVDGVPTRITVSVGAASAHDHGRTYEALSVVADEALYEVKNSGKGGFLLK